MENWLAWVPSLEVFTMTTNSLTSSSLPVRMEAKLWLARYPAPLKGEILLRRQTTSSPSVRSGAARHATDHTGLAGAASFQQTYQTRWTGVPPSLD